MLLCSHFELAAIWQLDAWTLDMFSEKDWGLNPVFFFFSGSDCLAGRTQAENKTEHYLNYIRLILFHGGDTARLPSRFKFQNGTLTFDQLI